MRQTWSLVRRLSKWDRKFLVISGIETIDAPLEFDSTAIQE